MASNLTTSRIGIAVNLPTDATYDLLVINNPQGYPTGQIFFQFETTPRKITGIQKAAQTFLRILFTTKGSDVVKPNTGTSFPSLVFGANRQVGNAEFATEISGCINDAASQAQGILNDSNSTDLASQIQSISLIGFDDTNVEALSMFIRLVTLAGETANVAIPFPQLDLKLSN